MLEFCLVTFDIDEIREASALFPVNCYADNPSVAAKDLAGGRATFLSRSREIRAAIGDEVPFYLEVLGDTSGEMVEDALRIVREIPGNTLVKIPACPEGYKAIPDLKNLGIDVNQALLAAAAGAVCVAVYVSRLDKRGGDGIGVVRAIRQAFDKHGIDCMVCAASLKTPGDVERALMAGAQNVTVDLAMLKSMACQERGVRNA